MDYGMIVVPAAPVRRKARHQGEMVNQLLFGDTVKLIKKKGEKWVKVRNLSDGYEGWITRSMLETMSEKEARAGSITTSLAADLVNTIHIGKEPMHIPLGASLVGWSGTEGQAGGLHYTFDGQVLDRYARKPDPELLRSVVAPWLNAPYLWGGKTIFGVDCSGFSQMVFKLMGIDLPRDAWQQAQEGKIVGKLKEAVCGDLAFFDDRDEIVHVGILLSSETIIHASGKVRVDTIDKKGIIHSSSGKRTHSLRVIKRFW